jgi:O-antigen/teichoic acid export membrane protein
MLKKLLSKAGVDKTIALTIVTRLISAFSGVLAVFFIARFLTGKEQGYYYTFGSIIAIQVFFELGLSGIITQYTAYEFAHLSWTDRGEVSGEDYYRSRLSSLLHFCVKWFAVIACILFFILLMAGYYFFTTYNNNADVEWRTPWFILCLSTSLNLFIDPVLAYFDGLGEIKDMSKVRLVQKISNVVLLFVFFACGLKLYSSALASLAAILINYFQIIFSQRINKLKHIWQAKGQWLIDYRKEILPFQVRIAISWISGYFIFQLFNPVLFATEGAVVAGQMGITLAVFNGISSISMSWINTKVPLFSGLIAKKRFVELDVTFNRTLKQLIIVNVLSIGFLIIGIIALKYLHISLVQRFLPLYPLILLGITVILNQFVFSWATYLRCHKEEPYLALSLVSGILIASSTILFGKLYGLVGIVYGYALLITVSFVWAYLIFQKKRSLWHNNT